MENKTLHEVCESFGVTRRAVQGYEKAGLVAASGKNDRGHLLYNIQSQERIRKIKLYQQLGFKIKEIQEIIDAPGEVLKEVLEKQVIKLKKEKTQIEGLIEKAYELINAI